jgi:hypothetical protein
MRERFRQWREIVHLTPVTDPLFHQLHEQRLLDTVVKRLDVGVYDPTLAVVDSQADLLTGLVGVPLWSEPI